MPSDERRYIQFHPLAYLVKLNIEMTMANLIKRIAVSASRRNGQHSIADEFKSSSNVSSTGKKSGAATQHQSTQELASIAYHAEGKANTHRTYSFVPTGNQIKTTQSITITSEPNAWPRRGSEVEISGAWAPNKKNVPHIIFEKSRTSRSKSIDSSIQSEGVVKRTPEDSDDEAALVGRGRASGRGPSKGS